MNHFLEGHWLDGHTSHSQPGTLFIDGRGQLFRDNQSLPCGDLADLQIPARLGNMPRTLRLGDELRFVCRQHEALDSLMAGRPSLNWVARLEAHWWVALAGLALMLATGLGSYRYLVPALAEETAHMLPAELLDDASREILAALPLKSSRLPTSRQREIRTAFQRLLERNDLPAERYRLLLRASDGLGANAFALPDGSIILLDDLVALSDHDDEWLAVLAHEVGHVDERHGLRRLLQQAMGTLLLTAVSGDVTAATGVLVDLPQLLLSQGYSRQFEHEADRYSVTLMTRAGGDPMALVSLLERLEAQVSAPSLGWLSTHPDNAARHQAVIDQVNRLQASPSR